MSGISVEELVKMISDLKRRLLLLASENARLKAEIDVMSFKKVSHDRELKGIQDMDF